jgi:hypothetical protein
MKPRRSSVAQNPFGGCVTIITSPFDAPTWNGDYGLLLSNGVEGRNSGLSCPGYHLITGQHLPRDCDELDGAAGGEGTMRILIAGVCGFVGSALAEGLLERVEDLAVSGIDNLIRSGSGSNRARPERMGVEFVHGDVCPVSELESDELTGCYIRGAESRNRANWN